jgi:hypothetical protein
VVNFATSKNLIVLSSAEVKNVWGYISTSPTSSWCLVKHRDNFTFALQCYHIGTFINTLGLLLMGKSTIGLITLDG